VNPLPIVECFDVLEHAQSGFFEILKRFMLGPLVLEGPEESFGYSVIVAVSLRAYRGLDAERLQSSLIRIARVLTASIAVV